MNEYNNIVINIVLQSIEQINKRASEHIDIDFLSNKFQLKEECKNIIKSSKSLSYSIDNYLEEETINKDNLGTVLESIFNVFRYNKEEKEKIYKIDPSHKLLKMPIEKGELTNNKEDYDSIILELKKNLEYILENEDLNSIMNLIERTMSTVPCKVSGEHIYDISLYDNTKLMVALAGCNYYFSKEENLENNKEKYILVSADISGIQNFIYTIASKGALRSLRGRSFYLEIIFENIIDEILNEIGLCRANLLYSGGGHFYMLLPNTRKVRKIIEDGKVNINQWFLETYGTSLYIEISYVTVNEQNLCNNDKKSNLIGELYKDVGSKNSKGKLQRYSVEQLERLILKSENKQDEAECTICHKSFELNDNICENCNNISFLGNNLPKIQNGEKVIVIEDYKRDNSLRIPSIDIKKEIYLNYQYEKKLSKTSYIRAYSINSSRKLYNKVININAGIYSKESKDKNTLINFDELADNSKGIKRLGVLRADVDNLGRAFTEGFELTDTSDKYKYISLSRNSNLSYSLSKFFKSGMNEICKGNFDGERFKILKDNSDNGDRNVAIVYAGGDDLFIVGAWNEIIELAVDINNEFKKFTNNKMTLSAGIGIFNPKYPIEQMASQVGELEHIAKINGKDRICLFDYMPENIQEEKLKYRHLYTWDEFENSVCKEKIENLYKWFDFEKNDKSKLEIGMSLLYRLLSLVRKIKSGDRINLARIAYLIGRLEPGKNKKELYIEFKETFYKWVLNENKKDLGELETALTLIIYLNRKDEENE